MPTEIVEPHWMEDDTLIIRCNCGCSLACFVEWDGGEDLRPGQWTVDFYEQYHSPTLRGRFKNAIHAFRNKWGGGHSLVWDMEQVTALAAWLDRQATRYANEIPDAKASPKPNASAAVLSEGEER